MASRTLPALLAPLALAGCQLGAEATLAREDSGALVVGVRSVGGGDGPRCLDNASIYRAGVGVDGPTGWSGAPRNAAACVQALRLPAAAWPRALGLVAGTHYCLQVSGAGFSDTRPFTLDAAGRPVMLTQGSDDGC